MTFVYIMCMYVCVCIYIYIYIYYLCNHFVSNYTLILYIYIRPPRRTGEERNDKVPILLIVVVPMIMTATIVLPSIITLILVIQMLTILMNILLLLLMIMIIIITTTTTTTDTDGRALTLRNVADLYFNAELQTNRSMCFCNKRHFTKYKHKQHV